ncbi:MAG: SpoVA/SpoVAEb family sporulation membrane protein [Oscillospiraceae bacterium]|jgi:stage V sporulation protein AC|nr:SpoVA/SpoVAEb family sporulation membrane protein [Oscillospiraceae bacterium]
MPFQMTKSEYSALVSRRAPKSKTARNMLLAFVFGGLICCAGQLAGDLLRYAGASEETVLAATPVIMVFLGVLFTALHLYDRLAKYAGAGTLVPITGFANAVAAPAIEFKSEGYVSGMAAKMFVIAGPVIVFGVAASAVYGVVLFVADKLGG